MTATRFTSPDIEIGEGVTVLTRRAGDAVRRLFISAIAFVLASQFMIAPVGGQHVQRGRILLLVRYQLQRQRLWIPARATLTGILRDRE